MTSQPQPQFIQVEGGSQKGTPYTCPPPNCDICGTDLVKVGEFIDGKTRHGPWANMCPICHARHGTGLGIGSGQRYRMSRTAETK